MKLDKIDWVIICTSVTLTGYLVWILMDDPVNRRLSTLHKMQGACQTLAVYFGELGMAAELEYHRVLETQRTI